MATINTLLKGAYPDGSYGFIAKNDDSAAYAFFDADGQELYAIPGTFIVLRELGQYDADDEDAFWSLVTSA